MNAKEYLNAIGDIDADLINDAAEAEPAPRRRLTRLLLPAAALVLIAAGAVTAALAIGRKTSAPAAPGQSALLETEAPPVQNGGEDVTVPEGYSGTGYTGFLIYGLQYYDLLADMPDGRHIVGERIGEVDVVIDGSRYFDRYYSDVRNEGGEYAPALQTGAPFLEHAEDVQNDSVEYVPVLQTAEPYMEHTGGIYGPIYAVKGYDPEVLVCQELTGGRVLVYFNVFAWEHARGSDLFERGLRISEKFHSLSYHSESIVYRMAGRSEEKYERLDASLYGARIEAFIRALCEAEWKPESEVFGEVRYTEDYVNDLMITFDGGLKVGISLWEDGCVFLALAWELNPGMVLCLDKEAAEGIAELVRGKCVNTEVPAPKTLEDAVNDPWLGYAVPKSFPEGFEDRGVGLIKFTLEEMESPSFSPYSRGEEDPTLCIGILLDPEGAETQFPDLHVDIVPIWNAREVSGFYDALPTEFIPIGEFTREDIRLYADDDFTSCAAFIQVGEAAVRVSVTAPNAEADALPGLIMEVIGSI